MDQVALEANRKKRNRRVAYVLGAVALAWYLMSMYTVWNL